jgi:hypothetical protein
LTILYYRFLELSSGPKVGFIAYTILGDGLLRNDDFLVHRAIEWGQTGNDLTNTQKLIWMIKRSRNNGSGDRGVY